MEAKKHEPKKAIKGLIKVMEFKHKGEMVKGEFWMPYVVSMNPVTEEVSAKFYLYKNQKEMGRVLAEKSMVWKKAFVEGADAVALAMALAQAEGDLKGAVVAPEKA